jgi:hypothetical protein
MADAAMLAAIRTPSKTMIEAGALAIMNERLRQGGMLPLDSLDMLYPHVLIEIVADAAVAWDAMILAAIAAASGKAR